MGELAWQRHHRPQWLSPCAGISMMGFFRGANFAGRLELQWIWTQSFHLLPWFESRLDWMIGNHISADWEVPAWNQLYGINSTFDCARGSGTKEHHLILIILEQWWLNPTRMVIVKNVEEYYRDGEGAESFAQPGSMLCWHCMDHSITLYHWHHLISARILQTCIQKIEEKFDQNNIFQS